MGAPSAKQLGFDLGSDKPPSYIPQVDDVRAELHEILAMLRKSDGPLPWDTRTSRYQRTVFPQMARWLPAEERDQLCAEFDREAERLGLPAAP